MMTFKLTNAPIVFTSLMNRVFRPCLDQYIVVVINNIPVYSISYKEHEQHLRNMLQTLRENKLCAKLDKCEFWLKKVVLLRHVISVKKVFVNPRKVEVVLKWGDLLM